MQYIENKKRRMKYSDFHRKTVGRSPLALYRLGFTLQEQKRTFYTNIEFADDLSSSFEKEEVVMNYKQDGEVQLSYFVDEGSLKIEAQIMNGSKNRRKLRADLEKLLGIKINTFSNTFDNLLHMLGSKD
ncbi:MAG: hypothetical protein AABX16_03675 [Nanoarchaeota archaeon]